MIEANKQRNTSNAVRPFEKVKISKACPSCSSVFITKKECESCGLQFWVDLVGEPFGERSFFVMQEDFIFNTPAFSKLLPKQRFLKLSFVQKYRRALLKRFEVLLGYFFDEVEEDRARRKVFLFEANQIIGEYVKLDGNPSALWALIDRGEKHPLAAGLYESLKKAETSVGSQSILQSSSGVSELLKRSIFREFLFTTGAVIVAAFLVFKYLNTY
jgi:hypothetical protein